MPIRSFYLASRNIDALVQLTGLGKHALPYVRIDENAFYYLEIEGVGLRETYFLNHHVFATPPNLPVHGFEPSPRRGKMGITRRLRETLDEFVRYDDWLD